MNRRQALKTLGLGPLLSAFSAPFIFQKQTTAENNFSCKAYPGDNHSDPLTGYLMAYFKSSQQQLFYAVSEDCRHWTTLNDGQAVLETTILLRDPFIGRVRNKFHLVHTKGWDYPVIYHYESDNLTDWEGGPIQVVPDDKKRAWAPEWYYEEKEGLFYVFWASLHNGHNTIFYVKTRNWKNIRPDQAKVYYDLGIDDIDFTITKISTGLNPGYYAFHKPGSLEDNFSVECMYSPSINPEDPHFRFGNRNYPSPVLPNMVKPIEGPEIVRLNKEDKWYIYADPFHQHFVAWETVDFKQFDPITVRVPEASKHCSILGITAGEMARLKNRFPV